MAFIIIDWRVVFFSSNENPPRFSAYYFDYPVSVSSDIGVNPGKVVSGTFQAPTGYACTKRLVMKNKRNKLAPQRSGTSKII